MLIPLHLQAETSPTVYGKPGLTVTAKDFENENAIDIRIAESTSGGMNILTFTWNAPLSEIEIRFPFMSYGENGTLTLPIHAGMRIREPEKAVFKPAVCPMSRWKDRRWGVLEEGLLNPEDNDKTDITYGRTATMQFCSYESPEKHSVLYAGFKDSDFEQTLFLVHALKEQQGFELVCRKVFNRAVPSGSMNFVYSIVPGDWHNAADIYRSWFDTLRLPASPCKLEYPGMICHYDFLWQNGDINHCYKDIPMLGKEAAEHGFNTIMCAGWHRGGFDTNYPDFRPSPKLGTEAEFKAAVEELHRNGQKIIVYVNAYSFDHDFELYDKVGHKGAIKLKDGTTCDVRWGTRTLTAQCIAAECWQDIVLGNLDYVLNTIGVDGVYMDQLNVTPPLCYDKEHRHLHSSIMNNRALAQKAQQRFGEKVIFLSEWSYDVMANVLDAQLLQTVWQNIEHVFPEMFRYAFPEAGALDMVVQKPWAPVDFDLEEKHIYNVFDRLILMGARLWCYDHAAFREPFRKTFEAGVKILKTYATELTEGKFLERIGIACPKGVDATRYLLPDGRTMYIVANKTGQKLSMQVSGGDLEIPSERYSVAFTK